MIYEEETLPHYDPQNFLPVNPGQVFRGRYQALTKLGFGGSSTVWLVKDLQKRV